MNDIPQSIRGDVNGVIRQYDYEAKTVIVADLGHAEGSVEVVSGTAIVVADGEQFGFDVSANVSRAVMNNGIVTVELEDTE